MNPIPSNSTTTVAAAAELPARESTANSNEAPETTTTSPERKTNSITPAKPPSLAETKAYWAQARS